MLMLVSSPTDALRPSTLQNAPQPALVSQTSATSGSTTEIAQSQSVTQPPTVPGAATPAPQAMASPVIAPIATRQSAEIVETLLRLEAPPPDAASEPEIDVNQARDLTLVAQSRWRDAQLIEAIQPAVPTDTDTTPPDVSNPEPSLAANAATQPHAEPRLMMTV
ncbi:MAG: hypothetical protein EA339_09995 [Rhodobacteraceae bacterium]|nr:MAG: hypothetical protein EA339_09995 [Paracoccaceae bacterium]